MTYDFDRIIDRRNSDSVKWRYYEGDVLPLWVADVDFVSPEPVVRALSERAAQGVFGYPLEDPELRPLIVDRLQRLYGWTISAQAIVFVPGVVPGFNLACRAFTQPGDGLLIQTPVYPPILVAHAHHSLVRQQMQLTRSPDGYYTIDFDAFESAIDERTRIFLLCNPHNPVGRCFTQAELLRMAEICLRHNVLICSDEIHSDLIFSDARHIPIAALAPEICRQTITVMAPSKTFNIAGLHCAFAVIEDEALRKKFMAARTGTIGDLDIFSYVAAVAAYRDGQPWLDEMLAYLERNRDHLADTVRERLPGISMYAPEGTYLAWLDCRALAERVGDPYKFFLEKARVALNAGPVFGSAGEGFLRLNFGCPRATLDAALERMVAAVRG